VLLILVVSKLELAMRIRQSSGTFARLALVLAALMSLAVTGLAFRCLEPFYTTKGERGTGWGQRLVADDEVPPHVDRVLNKPPRLAELRVILAELTA
jgi:hypothetical protein